jgi:cytochrome P450
MLLPKGSKKNSCLTLTEITCDQLLLYSATVIIYRLFFHPLRHFPGPWTYAASKLPRLWVWSIKGEGVRRITDLHTRYGSVVRISPNELSFADAAAWVDIYGPRQGTYRENAKDQRQYSSVNPADWETSILTSSAGNHARQRRMLAHAFSERSLRGQEGLIKNYVDLLMERLNERGGKVVDIVLWFNFTTFDIM